MAARKVLTRAESQARTRQDVLDAAARLFHANGYHGTSIAAIAAEAGRTIGAVYGNFAGKEELCLEVLRARYLAEVGKLLETLVGEPDSMEGRFDLLTLWWTRLSSDIPLTVLTSEYVLSTLADPDQTAGTRETINRFRDSLRVMVEDLIAEGVDPADPRVGEAIDAIIATGTGLALWQAIGMIDADQSAALLVSTLRMWMDTLTTPHAVDDKPAPTKSKPKPAGTKKVPAKATRAKKATSPKR
ncbi:putative transcriptional regulator, TetR family protein [Mycolicibacterium phocaicum]|nr:putative transcriptional regulator, TetR family protein [Mycolicibacterium phocaicum]